MRKEEIVIKKIIGDYLLTGKLIELERFLIKLKLQGKLIKVKKNLNFIIDYLYEKKDILVGELELAFDINQQLIQKKINQRGFFIKTVKVNPNLILGGRFRTKKIELNFSLLNILNNIFN